MRSDFIIKNSTWGIISQICNIVFGFIGRTVFISILGGDYLGISGLFTNILNILSLSELGFSVAVAYNLYKPLSLGDERKISAIMNFYKKVYRIVALTVLILGIGVIPFLEFLINKSPFDINFLRFIYFLYLIKTVTSYLFSYNYTIATADQRNYVLVNIDSISRIVLTALNVIVLISTHNYIFYLLVDIVCSLLINAVKSFVVKKKYPVLREKYVLKREEKDKIVKDVKNIFMGKVSTVIVDSTDSIIISIFINTLSVGIYSNYNMLIGYINGFIAQLTSSTQASLGNIFVTESKEYAIISIKRMMFVIFIPVSICATCLFCCLNPFIKIWIGNKYVKSQIFVGIIVLNFFLMAIRTPLWQGVSVSGKFKQDKRIAVIGALSNLIISLVLVQIFDISGVILGTVLSQLIQLVLKAKLLFDDYLRSSSNMYFKLLFKYLLIVIVEITMAYSILNFIIGNENIIKLFFSCLIDIGISFGIIFIVFKNSDELQYAREILRSILKKVGVLHE